VEHATFDGWWEPFEAGVGPAGAFLASLDATSAARLRERCREQLGDGPVVLADVTGLKRSVGFRIPEGELSCVVGIGAELWDRLIGAPRPAGLHPFPG